MNLDRGCFGHRAVFGAGLVLLLSTGTGWAAEPNLAAELAALKTSLNHVWVITAAALVLLMQCGFLMLEAGMVRSKNTINVAQKNVVDFFVSAFCFAVFGFLLMFGPSLGGWFGMPGPVCLLTGLMIGARPILCSRWPLPEPPPPSFPVPWPSG